MLFIPSPKYLRELRKAAGLSQAELARRAGVSQSLIARIESGDVNPRVSTLQRILKALEEYVEEELKAEDIMTSPVITVKTSDPISKVADIMWENAISQVPVLDERGNVVGMIHEKSIVKAFLKHREKAVNFQARDFMTVPPPMIPPDTPLNAVFALISDACPAVLVMKNDKVCGIITRSDVLKYMVTRIKSGEHRRREPYTRSEA